MRNLIRKHVTRRRVASVMLAAMAKWSITLLLVIVLHYFHVNSTWAIMIGVLIGLVVLIATLRKLGDPKEGAAVVTEPVATALPNPKPHC